MTGVGKSTAGNFILNEKDVFSTEGGLFSVTDKCSAATSIICDETVKIIDTPGFFDGFTPTEENFREVSRALTLAKDGIHAVAFVMNLNARYTPHCEEAMQQLLRLKGLQPFMFVILTHTKKIGATKAETDEYIQQKLLQNPRCPTGLKDLMQMVENHVLMLESVDSITENYGEQKRKEFIELVKALHKRNGYKVYVNPMLYYTAHIYEKVKLQQKSEIREKTKTLKLNSEKIEQLKKQADHTENTEGTRKINNEIADLDNHAVEVGKKVAEIADELYPENLTQRILVGSMVECVRNQEAQLSQNRNKFTIFMHSFLRYHKKQSPFGSFNVLGGVAAGALVGAGIGAITGVVIPGANLKDSAVAGVEIGASVGAVIGDAYEPASKAYDDCKQQ